ncbi:MAG TPA: VCBS repeat-containing protein [Pyrinomonadaceae bacterium]|nr:VCBS repeat-containing protein [Pyrinomonadaceae bacterium]
MSTIRFNAGQFASRTGIRPFACVFSLAAFSMLFLFSCNFANPSSTATQNSYFVNAPGSPISVPNGPGNVLIGDMNNDRKLDLIVTFGSTRRILVLPGKGDGQFGAPLSETTVTDTPGEMAVADLNRDGKLDLAVSSHDSYGVMLLLGDGRGNLAVAPTSPIVMKLGQHPHTHGMAVADMNRDDKLDLIIANNADNDISIALGDGRGNFTRAAESPFPVGPSPYPFAVGDVNNDGWIDIVATASATGPSRREQLHLSRALTLLLSNGKGGFASRQLPTRTGEPWFAAIGDFNGDGKADIVATHHEQNAMTVMIGNGRGGFAEGHGSPFDFGLALFHVVIADVNRDAKNDVISTSGDSIRVMLGDGSGGFQLRASMPVGRGAWRLAVADLNADGRSDVVTSNSESNSVSVLLGR